MRQPTPMLLLEQLKDNFTRKNIIIASIVLIALVLAIVAGVKLAPVSASSMAFEEKTMFIAVGQSKAAIVKFTPSNATNKELIFTSDNTAIATINQHGVITGIKPGKATISASNVKGGFTTYLKITVENPITSLSFKPAELTMRVNDTQELVPNKTPVDAGVTGLVYFSSNKEVVKISGNLATAVSVGEAIVTVKDSNGSTKAELKITVISAVDLILSETEVALSAGTTTMIDVTFAQEDVADKTLEWTSSDDTIATVTSTGVITGVREGTCVITVKHTSSAAIKTINVTVRPAEVRPSIPSYNTYLNEARPSTPTSNSSSQSASSSQPQSSSQPVFSSQPDPSSQSDPSSQPDPSSSEDPSSTETLE